MNCGYEIKWSYDPCSYKRNFCNCVKKPETFRTSTEFEPVTSRDISFHRWFTLSNFFNLGYYELSKEGFPFLGGLIKKMWPEFLGVWVVLWASSSHFWGFELEHSNWWIQFFCGKFKRALGGKFKIQIMRSHTRDTFLVRTFRKKVGVFCEIMLD